MEDLSCSELDTNTTKLVRNRRHLIARRRPMSSYSAGVNYYRRRRTSLSSAGRSRPAVSRRGLIRMKVRRLQKLVPGGKELQPDRLFLQTANYILHLKFKVNVLQTLSNLYKP